MCIAFAQHRLGADYAAAFGLPDSTLPQWPAAIAHNYNFRIGKFPSIIILSDGKPRLISGKWGYRPAWAEEANSPPPVGRLDLEAAMRRPYYRYMWKEACRLIVPIDGFYEWSSSPKEAPSYSRLKTDKPMLAVAMTNVRLNQKSPPGSGFTLIAAAGGIRHPGEMRPIVLGAYDALRWISQDTPLPLAEALARHAGLSRNLFISYQVSSAVENAETNDAYLIEPWRPR